MSLFGRQRRDFLGITGAEHWGLVPRGRSTATGSVTVTADTALRQSAVWACLRLRAGLISTMPLDVFRKVLGLQVEMPKPPVLVAPGGERWDLVDWMYASQFDLDRGGNTIGLITETNSLNLPSRIDLQSLGDCTVLDRKDTGLKYRIGGKEYPPEKVWHERQYVIAGLPVGLSPVAYAAWTIGQYQSAQQFALDWYGSGGIAKGQMRNTAMPEVKQPTADAMKVRFKASVEGRDVFVTGKDWEYSPIQAEAVGMEWLEAQKFGIGDVARFFDCPGDLIDAAVTTGNITYANVTQRNLQFLIMHLGPAVFRREKALSKLLPVPRFVKLNRDALLAMDPETRTKVITERINNRTLAPSEGRALENLPPLTEEQIAEFDRLFGSPRSQPVTATSGATP